MNNINKVILSGKLTNNPIIKTLPSGSNVLSFNLETVQEFKNQSGTKRTVNYIDCVLWGNSVESYAKYLAKDSQVLVEGQISLDTFTAQSGEKKTKHKVNVQNINFLDFNSMKTDSKRFEQDSLPF